MTTVERLKKAEDNLANAKRQTRRLVIAGAVTGAMILSMAGCGKSENAALREKVAALEKAQIAMAKGFAEKVAALEQAQAAMAKSFAEQQVTAQDLVKKVATLEKALETRSPEIAQALNDAAQAATDAPQSQEVLPVVSARSFVLVDENGKVRACLGMDANGPGLELYDENGYVAAPPDMDKSESQPAPTAPPVRPRRQGRY
jgi:hypothetical protein